MSLKKKSRKRAVRRHRIAQERRDILAKQAPPTPSYVMYHDPRGVNESGGRHIPETKPGHHVTNKRVVIGTDRLLVNKDLVIDAKHGINVRVADVVASVAYTNAEMHSSWSARSLLPGSNREVSRLEVMIPDLKAISAMMGSTVARGIASFARTNLTLNPKQAGNPDLLPTPLYNRLIEKHQAWIEDHTREKINWSRIGIGIEMKSTCGSVNLPELAYAYDATRVDMLSSINFSAHHHNNTVLLGVWWDYIAGVPQVVGVFYGNNFNKDDFSGSDIKDLGERSTPVCSLTRKGMNKLSYVCVMNDARYIGAVAHILPCSGL